MIRGVRQGARWSAVLLTLGLLVGPAATVSAANDATTDDAEAEETQREVANIKVEMKTPRGRVVKLDGDLVVDWGVETALDIQADGSTHQLQLTVQRKGEKKSNNISITLGYNLDGEAIIAPYTFDSKVKKREVVRIEGGAAFAITITPKTIKAEEGGGSDEGDEVPPEETEPPRDKIEIEDGDDPLGGLEK